MPDIRGEVGAPQWARVGRPLEGKLVMVQEHHHCTFWGLWAPPITATRFPPASLTLTCRLHPTSPTSVFTLCPPHLFSFLWFQVFILFYFFMISGGFGLWWDWLRDDKIIMIVVVVVVALVINYHCHSLSLGCNLDWTSPTWPGSTCIVEIWVGHVKFGSILGLNFETHVKF